MILLIYPPILNLCLIPTVSGSEYEIAEAVKWVVANFEVTVAEKLMVLFGFVTPKPAVEAEEFAAAESIAKTEKVALNTEQAKCCTN